LVLFLIPTIPLSAVSAIFISVLTARNRLALATAAPGISIVVVAAAIYGFARQWGIYSVAVGTTLGLVLQTLVLAIILKRPDFRRLLIWRGLTATTRSFFRQIVIVAAGGFIINFIDMIDQYSAGIIGPGNLSALNYGNKFVLAVMGPASIAVSTAVLPHMSELVCTRDFVAAKQILKTYSMMILAVTIPLTILLVVWSPTIVMVLFERNAFTSHDTLQVAAVQRAFLLQIPLHVLGMLFVSLVWSLRANWVFLVINPICLLLKIWLNAALSATYGVPGIGFATTITYGVSCALLLIAGTWLMRREERASRRVSDQKLIA
jgi:putative peptidoglycan lipid II flippase